MKQIPLSGKHGEGRHALIDDADEDLVSPYDWFAQKDASGKITARAYVNGGNGTIALHSLISRYPMTVHLNGDTLDCRRENLARYASRGR